MFDGELRMLTKLRLENVRVGVAEVSEVICSINHLKGKVIRGSSNGGGGKGMCTEQPATADIDEELVIGQENYPKER